MGCRWNKKRDSRRIIQSEAPIAMLNLRCAPMTSGSRAHPSSLPIIWDSVFKLSPVTNSPEVAVWNVVLSSLLVPCHAYSLGQGRIQGRRYNGWIGVSTQVFCQSYFRPKLVTSGGSVPPDVWSEQLYPAGQSSVPRCRMSGGDWQVTLFPFLFTNRWGMCASTHHDEECCHLLWQE